MIGKLSKARQLSARSWLYLVESWFTLLAIYITTKLLPYRYWRNRLKIEPDKQDNQWPRNDKIDQQSIIDNLNLAARNHIVSINCLHRSLALHAMLHRRGFYARVIFGVKKTGGGIEGHAWVQKTNQVIGDHKDIAQQYFPITNNIEMYIGKANIPD